MIERLVTVLQRAALDVTPREMAEAIWLAQFLPAAPAREDRRAAPEGEPVETARDAQGAPPAAPRPAPAPPSPPAVAEPQAEAPLTLPDRTAAAAAGPAARGGMEVKSPSALALPDALEISRSLRPLRRRVQDGRSAVIDERLTAERIADSGLWIPVARPARSRWLDVALVVDLAGSMAIWRQAVRELTRLLERNGAFRDVRTWGLVTERGSPALVQGGVRGQARRERRPEELLDPAGRRLIAVFSDCTSPAWRTGAAQRLLRGWGRRGPVTLIQPLPSSLWHRTGLGSGLNAAMASRVAAAPNARLRWSTDSALEEGEQGLAFPLPVIHLDKESIGGWARMVAGDPRASAPGIAWLPPADGADGASAPAELTAERRVARFRSASSPQAQTLAGYLSAVPLTLPIMRLVWQSAFAAPRAVHLAEVFLGGLMREVAAGAGGDPEGARYDFHEGVRELLLEEVPVSDSVEVLRRVSDYVEERLGQAFNFRAALRDPDELDIALDRPGEREFARVAAKVLRRLGGRYARLADRLEGKAPPRPRKERPTPAEEALAQRTGFVVGGGTGFLIDERTFATCVDVPGPYPMVGRVVPIGFGGSNQQRLGRVSRIDWEQGFALIELHTAFKALAPIPIAELTPSSGSWVLLGTDWSAGLLAVRGPIRADSAGPQLEYTGRYPDPRLLGGGVLVNGQLLGMANWPAREQLRAGARSGHGLVVTPFKVLEQMRDASRFKPNGWSVAVTGSDETLGPVPHQLSLALGAALADAGYRLRTLDTLGVNATVGVAYEKRLARHGAAPEELTVIKAPPAERVEQLLHTAHAVIGIGGAHETGRILEAAQARGIPIVPLAAAGGDAARILELVRRAGAPAWLDPDVGLLSDEDQFATRAAAAAIRSLDRTRNERRGRRILVVGCGTPQDVTECIREVSLAVGRRLANDGHRLLGGGWPGVDEIVGQAFVSTVVASGGDPSRRFIQYLSSGRKPRLSAGRIEPVDRDYQEALEAADALVLIGGHDFTLRLARRARKLGKPVLPIRRTGQAAEQVYQELIHEQPGPWSEIGSLGDAPTPGIDPESALGLAEKVSTLLAEGFKREQDYGAALISLILQRVPEPDIKAAIETAISDNVILGWLVALATGRGSHVPPTLELMRSVAFPREKARSVLEDAEPRLLARDAPLVHELGGLFVTVALALADVLAGKQDAAGRAELARMVSRLRQPFSNPLVQAVVEMISRRLTAEARDAWLQGALGVSYFGYAFRHGFEAEVVKALAQTVRRPRAPAPQKKAPSGDTGSWKSVVDHVRRLPALKQLAALPPLLDHYYIAHDDPQLRATAYLVAAATDEATFRENVPVFVARERERVSADARQALATRLLLYCAANLPPPEQNDAGRRSLRGALRSLHGALNAARGQASADQELLSDAQALCTENLARLPGPASIG